MAKKRSVGTKHLVTAKFGGEVVSLHVFFAGHEIPMSQNGSKWNGKKDYDVAGRVRAELVFKAPSGTDYKFGLKIDKAGKINDDGTNKAPFFSRGFDVEV